MYNYTLECLCVTSARFSLPAFESDQLVQCSSATYATGEMEGRPVLLYQSVLNARRSTNTLSPGGDSDIRRCWVPVESCWYVSNGLMELGHLYQGCCIKRCCVG